MTVPVSVLIATRNEEGNLPRCLDRLVGWADEIVVVDSYSTDSSVAMATDRGVTVVHFDYAGGWPKKRQWALDTYPFRNEWILILDADEFLTCELKSEIAERIGSEGMDGYYLTLSTVFLGRPLRHGGFNLEKLALFRRGSGRYECRIKDQTTEMSDVEIHEHVIVDGRSGHLQHHAEHRNVNNLHRYIEKHNEYSTWEARVMLSVHSGDTRSGELAARAWAGSQAQRRRWLKHKLFWLPGLSVVTFLYHYVARLGFLDGLPGLIYCAFQGIQRFHVKVKLRELRELLEQAEEETWP